MKSLFPSSEEGLFLAGMRHAMTPPRFALATGWNELLLPDSRLWQINEAWQIIECMTAHYRPDHIFLLFSGGYDSLVASHLSMLLLNDMFRKYSQHFGERIPRVHVLHLNTGIGIPETREYVRNVASGFHCHYLEYTTPESYEDNVLLYGFPGPAQHTTLYIRLKERALRLAIRDHAPLHPLEIHRQEVYDLLSEMQRLPLRLQIVLVRLLRRHFTRAIQTYRREELRPMLFVTGVRKQESVRRMGTVQPIQKHGRHYWLSPLTNWSAQDVLSYRDDNALPHNLVVDTLHKSGECLCGAFAKAGELEEISFWYPEVGAFIKELERKVRAKGFTWGWEGAPPRRRAKKFAPTPGQLLLPGFEEDEKTLPQNPQHFSPLCSSCIATDREDHLDPL